MVLENVYSVIIIVADQPLVEDQMLYNSSPELISTQPPPLLPHNYGRKCGSFHFSHVTGCPTNPRSPP